jgi:transposase
MFEPFPLGLGKDDGVIDMELLSVIRRWHYRDHFSIREISRRTGLSTNTVRKYLRSDTVEPKFNIAERPSKLDPYADKLSQMLRQEAGKSRKQKRTTKQLHADLAALGYDGSDSRVAAFARDWKAARQQEQKTSSRGVSCRWRFCRAKRSSSTGRKIGRSSAASGPNCRSLTSSSPTAAPSFSAPIPADPRDAVRRP